jgi:arylsulfatase A-like enzyme
VEALGAVIDRYYETEDATLGELLKMAADDGTVAVIASHGYVGLRYGATGNLKMGAEMYSEQGLFIIRGPRIAKNVRATDGTLLDVAPTIMAAAAIPAPATIDGKVHEEVLVAR